MPRELSPEQRDQLVALFHSELRRAWVAAQAAGADPVVLDRIVAERRRRLRRSLVRDDGACDAGDPPDGGGVGE